MRAQFLNGELFYTLKDAQILMERWRVHYNTVRPHSSLGGQPPAPRNNPACELRTHMVGGTKTPGWSADCQEVCVSLRKVLIIATEAVARQ